MSVEYNRLIELGNDQKLIGASEVGSAPRPDQLQAYQAHWLWFAVWSDGFINNADYNPPELLNEVSAVGVVVAERGSTDARRSTTTNTS